jgi:hypothetical protein
MKRLKCRYNKIEREHEYNKKLVNSAKTIFETPCSGVDEQMQAPAWITIIRIHS